MRELLIVTYSKDFISGIALTFLFSIIGMGGGLLIGTIGAFMKRSKTFLSKIATFYVGLFRNTPLLVQLLLVYFGIPALGIPINSIVAGFITVIINNGAYLTEIIRGGMAGVTKNEIDAGYSLGLTKLQVNLYVIIPRVIRIIFPSLGNQFILLIISSSLLSQIGIKELFHTAMRLEAETFRSFEVYITTMLLYIIITIILTTAFRWLSRRFIE